MRGPPQQPSRCAPIGGGGIAKTGIVQIIVMVHMRLSKKNQDHNGKKGPDGEQCEQFLKPVTI